MDEETVIIEHERGRLLISILVGDQEWTRACDAVGARYALPTRDVAMADAIKALATLDWVSKERR